MAGRFTTGARLCWPRRLIALLGNLVTRETYANILSQALRYHAAPTPPLLLADGVAGLTHAAVFGPTYRSYAWTAPLGPQPCGGLRPAVSARPERGKRLEPSDPLMQPIQLLLALRALVQVLPRDRDPRLTPRLAQCEQGVHGEVSHGATSSPSQRRSRVCARAN